MIGEHRNNRFFDYEGNEIEVGDYFKIIDKWGVCTYLAEEIHFEGSLRCKVISDEHYSYNHFDSQSINRCIKLSKFDKEIVKYKNRQS